MWLKWSEPLFEDDEEHLNACSELARRPDTQTLTPMSLEHFHPSPQSAVDEHKDPAVARCKIRLLLTRCGLSVYGRAYFGLETAIPEYLSVLKNLARLIVSHSCHEHAA